MGENSYENEKINHDGASAKWKCKKWLGRILAQQN